ncbi:MAG TPA: hypothetical protein VGB77_06580 [Abditibacteriaceae bacterium]|jgi:hypothetical protein
MVKIKSEGSPQEPIEVEDADKAVVVGKDAKLLILHFREIPTRIEHEHYFDQLCGVAGANGVQLPPCIVVVGDNIDLSALGENRMSELGWVRAEKAPHYNQVQA